MALANDPFSRFILSSTFINDDGAETFGRFKRYSFLDPENLSEDQVFQVEIDHRYAGRPDLIAGDVYGSAFLEWVVIHFKPNQPFNTLGWPAIGAVIELPVPAVVFAQLR